MKILLISLFGLLLLWLIAVQFAQRKDTEQGFTGLGSSEHLPMWLFRMGAWMYGKKESAVQWVSRTGMFDLAGIQKRQYQRYQASRIGDWSREAYAKQQAEHLALAWLVLPVSCLLAFAVSMKMHAFLGDSTDGQQLLRPEQWNQSTAYELYVDGLGERQEISVSIDGQMQESAEALLMEKAERLEQQILGENESLEMVCRDLELIEELDGVINISWRSLQPELISSMGTVNNAELEDPELAELWATLSYGDAELIKVITVRIMPAVRDEAYYKAWLLAEIENRNREGREEAYVNLPESVDEQQLEYGAGSDFRPLYLLLLGVVIAGCLCLRYGQQIESDYRKRNRGLQREYSSIVSQFAVLLQCGLPVRGCWQKIVQTYEREQEEGTGMFSFAYEEMLLTYRQMTGGMQECRAYTEFGNRCELYMYRRFGMLLEQTVRQGSSGLAQILENEAFQAMEERKNLARKRAAEAEARMMLPMFMMLGVVIVIVMVPALLTM